MNINKDILQRKNMNYKGVQIKKLSYGNQLHIKTAYSNYMISKDASESLKIYGGHLSSSQERFPVFTPIKLIGALWINKVIPDWIICGMKFELYLIESKEFVTTSKIESILIRGQNFYYELNNY